MNNSGIQKYFSLLQELSDDELNAKLHDLITRIDEYRKELISTEALLGDSPYDKQNPIIVKQRELENKLRELTYQKKAIDQYLKEGGNRKKSFDKRICFENIRFLLSRESVKLGDIERNAGLTPGYMSRLEKEGNASDPSVEFVVTAAEMLGITVDTLLNSRLTSIPKDEELLIKFFTAVKEDTETGNVVWVKNNLDELTECRGCARDPEYFTILSEPNPNSNDFSVIYSSYFLPKKEYLFIGTCYQTQSLGTEDELILMKMELEDPPPEFTGEFIEVYHKGDGGSIEPLCNNAISSNEMNVVVKSLFERAAISASHIHISEETRGFIDDYMKTRFLAE